MASPFSFGFSGDDIGESDDVAVGIQCLGLGDDLQQRQRKMGVVDERVDRKPMRCEPRLYMLDDFVRCVAFIHAALHFFVGFYVFCDVFSFGLRWGLRGVNYALPS